MRPEMWARTTWPLSSSTRKVVLGRVSTTLPSIWMLSSLAIILQGGLGRADSAVIPPAIQHARSGDALPPRGAQPLMGAETVFVGHLAALCYPISQIQPVETAAPRFLDLP